MKIAVTADLHFKGSEKNSVRLEHIIKAYEWVAETAYKKGAKALIIAGDVFHHRKSIPVDVLVAAFEALSKCKLPQYILVGNHDISIQGSTISARIFRKIATVIDKPTVHNIDGADIGFIPWENDPNKIRKAIRKINTRYLIGHLGLAGGAVGGSGYVMEGGVQPKLFANFDWVILGHYHKRQKLNNIRYVGSPLQHNFGEVGEDKGFFIVEDSEVRFVRNTFSPQFVDVCTDDDLQYIGENDFIRATEDMAHKIAPERITKIIPNAPKTNKARIEFRSLQRGDILRQYIDHFPLDDIDDKVLLESGLRYLNS